MKKLSPIHPGEILSEDFLIPLGLSATAFSKKINVPANRITRIVAGQSSVTADTALRFSKAFRTTPQFWMNLQSNYELRIAADKAEMLQNIEPLIAA